MIRNDYSQINSRQLFGMFNKALDASVSKSRDEITLTLRRNICAHFNNSKDSAIMSLFYLKIFEPYVFVSFSSNSDPCYIFIAKAAC